MIAARGASPGAIVVPLADALGRRPTAPADGATAHPAFRPGAIDTSAAQAAAALEQARRALHDDAVRLVALRGDLEARYERLAHGLAAASQATEAAGRTVAADAVRVGLLLAEQLVGHALAVDAGALAALVHRALRAAGDEPELRARLCPADVARIDGALSVTIAADPTLQPGDCVIESPRIVVDARLATRIAAIRDELDAIVTAADVQQEQAR